MGWSFACDPKVGKADIVKQLKNEGFSRHWMEGVEIVATRVVGNNVWQVLKSPDGKLGITLTLLQSGYPEMGWGWKSIDETHGPNEKDCPLSFLDMVPDPGSYATAWRAGVREYHAQQRTKTQLKVGDPVKIYGKPYRLREKARRGWVVVSMLDGKHYRAAKDYFPITEAEAMAMIQAEAQKHGEPQRDAA